MKKLLSQRFCVSRRGKLNCHHSLNSHQFISERFYDGLSLDKRKYSSIFPINLSEDQVNSEEIITSSSSQELGRRFEAQVVEYLSEYDFNLSVTKRSHDQGIDFKGFWNFPFLKQVNPHPIPILGQCKREKDAVGVKYIREFEGVLSHYQLQKSANQNVVGVFVSYSGFSEHAVRQALDSKQPIILVILTTVNEKLLMTYFCMNHMTQKIIPKVTTSIERAVDGDNQIIFSVDN